MNKANTKKVSFKGDNQPDYGLSDVEIGLATVKTYDQDSPASDVSSDEEVVNTSEVPEIKLTRSKNAWVPLRLRKPTKETKKPVLDLYSLDFDGCCAAHAPYKDIYVEICTSTQPEQMKRHHEFKKAFYDFIESRNKDHEREVISGSYRQDVELNSTNEDKYYNNVIQYKKDFPKLIPKPGDMCAFKQLRILAEKIKARYNPLLFADGDDKEPGFSEKHHFRDARYNGPRGLPFREDKVSIILFQARKISEKYPNHKINFLFFDDRIDILESLSKIEKHQIPDNVDLNLYKYDWNGYVIDGDENGPIVKVK